MTRRLRQIRDIARNIYGYEHIRAEQEEAILAVLDGCDTLAVMPTGSGKSAIYQIAALMIDGPTVVISPLIALQKDQAEYLQDQDAGGAVVINSQLPPDAAKTALQEATKGSTEFLFLGPEQFSNAGRLEALRGAKPSLIVIDEAHCISEWGHSFRPDYLRLGAIVEMLGHPKILALTATANAAVRDEIVTRLGMRKPKVFVHGLDRPNIWLGVEVAASETKKRALLLGRVQSAQKPGIVYTSTRKQAETICDELRSMGLTSAVYHAGLAKHERNRTQELFMRGELETIVATCAFGMGVDKSNVRFVFHFAPPDSIDSYYQEIGRAGRDGQAASAVLFYCNNDLKIYKFFKGAGQIGEADITDVMESLSSAREFDEAQLRGLTRLSKIKLSRIVSRLEDCGALIVDTGKKLRIVAGRPEFSAIAARAANAQAQLHEAELARIRKIGVYAESLECRRAQLIAYFGGEFPEACGNCDNCQGTGTHRAELIARTRLAAISDAATA